MLRQQLQQPNRTKGERKSPAVVMVVRKGMVGDKGKKRWPVNVISSLRNEIEFEHTHKSITVTGHDRPAAGPPFFFFFYLDTNGRMGPSDRPLKSPDPIQTLPRVTFISSIIFHRHSNKKKKKKKKRRERERHVDVISILFSPLHRTGETDTSDMRTKNGGTTTTHFLFTFSF